MKYLPNRDMDDNKNLAEALVLPCWPELGFNLYPEMHFVHLIRNKINWVSRHLEGLVFPLFSPFARSTKIYHMYVLNCLEKNCLVKKFNSTSLEEPNLHTFQSEESSKGIFCYALFRKTIMFYGSRIKGGPCIKSLNVFKSNEKRLTGQSWDINLLLYL